MQTSALRVAEAPHLHGVRVLVVNDMRPVRQVVTDILECAGATVTAVVAANPPRQPILVKMGLASSPAVDVRAWQPKR